MFRTATVSRPHHRLHQPWVAGSRSGGRARRARRKKSWATSRSDSSFQRHAPVSHRSTHNLSTVLAGIAWGPQRTCGVLQQQRQHRPWSSSRIADAFGWQCRKQNHVTAQSLAELCRAVCHEVEAPAIVGVDARGQHPSEPLLRNDVAFRPDCVCLGLRVTAAQPPAQSDEHTVRRHRCPGIAGDSAEPCGSARTRWQAQQ